jgi:opacity protein-like surface antigen
MLRKLALTTALLTAIAAATNTASAQHIAAPNGFAVGAMAGGVTFADSTNSTNFGFGADANIRWTFSGLQLVGGGGYNSVAVENLSANRIVWTVFADLRLLMKTTPGAAPYIGIRVGYGWSTVDISELEISNFTEAKQNGPTFSGIFGVLFPLSPNFAIDGALTFGVAPFGDIEFNTGDKLPDSSTTGMVGSLKVGIVYSFTPYK